MACFFSAGNQDLKQCMGIETSMMEGGTRGRIRITMRNHSGEPVSINAGQCIAKMAILRSADV